MKRSEFIKASVLAGGGLLLSIRAWGSNESSVVNNSDESSVHGFGNFLSINESGDVFFQLTKHEMGQGVATSLAMILAEELDADWEKVNIVFADAEMSKYQNTEHGGLGTGGSTTILDMYPLLRKAGATAREMLLQAAAQMWKVESSSCRTEKGQVVLSGHMQSLSYGELATAAAKQPVPLQVRLKDTKTFNTLGKPLPGKLTSSIVTGKNIYGIDAQLPGMLYAVVERCPVYRGKLKSFNASKTMKVKGVKKVVTTQAVAGVKGNFQYDLREGVAVVADSFWAAQKGREALIVEWDEGVNKAKSIQQFEDLVAQRAQVRHDPTGFVGDENATADLTKVKRTMRAGYVYPYQLHSMMEPLNCTAHFRRDSCELHIGVQAPHLLIRQITALFKIPQDKIVVHLHPSGGGFGRRWYPDAGLEALCISKEAGNVPVKMLWTREDDQTMSYAHCYVHGNYQASINSQNELVAWYHKELRSYTWGASFANPELTWIGYAIPNIRYDFEDLLQESLVQSCAWRSVVANAWAFGQECFIDEIATELKTDPLNFRLSLLKEGRDAEVGHQHTISNTRLIRVLNLAAEKSNWGKKLEEGRGQGIAAYPYMHGNSYCAVVAEVTCRENKLKVDKVTCAVDCGKVINPSGAKNQIEGGVAWALTALLHGGLNIKNGRATQTNFHQNKLLRMNECPQIEVYFVETTDEQPWGIGELSPPPTVPAVINAIFAATGKRVRKLPIVL